MIAEHEAETTLTALLLRRGMPAIGTILELYWLVTLPVSRFRPLNCTVAPSTESTREPTNPMNAPRGISRHCWRPAEWKARVPEVPANVGEISAAPQKAKPTRSPPPALAANPRGVTPPFVPRLTGRMVVINLRGRFWST